MIGVYFSGSGNTKYCVNKFLIDCIGISNIFPIEDRQSLEEIKKKDNIVLAYPIYYSNLPKIVYDFIVDNRSVWIQKNVFIIATMGLFSGDGAGLSARLLKRYGANIVGGLHLKMPDSVADVKALKRSYDKNVKLIKDADKKIEIAANNFKAGEAAQEGLNFLYHIAGLFGQRLWFYNKTKDYTNKLKIDHDKCVGCGKCALHCPMKNLQMVNKKAVSNNRCTMCYRCINQCPQKAITLLGDKVISQHCMSSYI
ncbi:4Fe-4S ferredoxin iron-sulfur binding domain-containing protein [Tepidanaerobacter acetatoxydans Re1]|uniref:4Fe-4S ferredoxin iron-sulfur binding domain-containing protein n=1 Tax=Tepidanaerobacter acetatoxydans (strain DSM 21804 / JCM 16047 / Re1) TaxID=1209989 RepID=F4LR89_TEPAE|nr:EFR1 family ferrodoxin [Tepidanaerobacter acetatoxydans]AEE91103.1 4Fe-4S ferredoxin iron-sulfur binding domain-containing protein [Tepidanaerobacter acetatoxydans Re1]CCP25753.1 4Fe-4S ferredoxin iron-sulfur binding domain-containing protein [Tepidanaerobacter acetatoxydans Re1]